MPTAALSAEEAIGGRRSIRAFRPDPIPPRLLEHLLDIAARAPSGSNMQPWRVYAIAGAVKERLSTALVAAHAANPAGDPEYRYYPETFFEPYLSRRRTLGWDLYGRLGITRGESERMQRQHARNFLFFDAPVGLIFTIDRRLEIGSWLDYGMFLQNLMVAARAHELETCVQAAFAPFHLVVREHLPVTDAEVVICGMSLGYPVAEAPENQLVTERVPAGEFATFLGFDASEPDLSAGGVTCPR